MEGSVVYNFINASALRCIDFAGIFYFICKNVFQNSADYCYLLCIPRIFHFIFIFSVVFFISVAFLRSFLNTKKGRDYIQVVGDFQVGGLPSKWWEEAGGGGGGAQGY